MILINKNLQTFLEKLVYSGEEICARNDAGFFGKENDKFNGKMETKNMAPFFTKCQELR